MGMPLLIGAGVGALGSAAMGKSPFTGALLGGATGGMLGGAGGLFGSAPAVSAAGGADVAAGTVAPAILGTPTLNASLLTQGSLAGLGATPSVYGGLGASSFLDKTGAFLGNNIGNPLTNMSTMDKINLGMKGMDVVNQPSQPIQSVQGQIRQGNPNPSSPVFKVAPNITSSGLKDMMAHIPYTEEDLMRLQQLGYRG